MEKLSIPGAILFLLGIIIAIIGLAQLAKGKDEISKIQANQNILYGLIFIIGGVLTKIGTNLLNK